MRLRSGVTYCICSNCKLFGSNFAHYSLTKTNFTILCKTKEKNFKYRFQLNLELLNFNLKILFLDFYCSGKALFCYKRNSSHTHLKMKFICTICMDALSPAAATTINQKFLRTITLLFLFSYPTMNSA